MVLCLSLLTASVQQAFAVFKSVDTKRPTFTAIPILVSACLKAKIMNIRLPKPSIRSDETSRFTWELKVC